MAKQKRQKKAGGKPPRKRTSPASRKSAGKKKAAGKQAVRQGLQQLAYVGVIFLSLVVLSLGFLLYQWKDYQITEYAKEIEQLRAEVLRLQSDNSRKQAYINTELLKYHRIARIAEEKLGLKPALQKPTVLVVDKQKLEAYAQKDREEEAKEAARQP